MDIGNVTVIGDEAFSLVRHLEIISFNKVQTIGNNVFDSEMLLFIELPSSLNSLGKGAFFECVNLEKVVFLGNPEFIGEGAFVRSTVIYGPKGGSVEKFAKENGNVFKEYCYT